MKKLSIRSKLSTKEKSTLVKVLFAQQILSGKKDHGPVKKLTIEEIWELYPEEAEKFNRKIRKNLDKDIKNNTIPFDKLKGVFPDIDFEDFK